jgi:hypothetical protein
VQNFVNAALATFQQLEVDIDKGGDGGWWTNPLYIGIGVIVLLLVVLISVTAARRA